MYDPYIFVWLVVSSFVGTYGPQYSSTKYLLIYLDWCWGHLGSQFSSPHAAVLNQQGTHLFTGPKTRQDLHTWYVELKVQHTMGSNIF